MTRELENISPDYLEAQQSIGEDELQYLREIKQDFFALMAKVKIHTELTPEEFADFVVSQEEELDEVLYDAWHKACDKAGYGATRPSIPVSLETQKYRDEIDNKMKERNNV